MIQWFPGHMTKARRLITENLKLVDVIVELADARIPISSRNPLLSQLIGNKPRLLVMTKADLAEPEITKEWQTRFKQEGIASIEVGFMDRDVNKSRKLILEGIKAQASRELARRENRGVKNTTLRVMVAGIPNVGKSTFVNSFAGRSIAETADRPGVTRGKQWIRMDKELELLDMPGILWPKIDDSETGYKLATTGAIGEGAFDYEELAIWLINWLKDNRPGRLENRYSISEAPEAPELLEIIAKKRGYLRKGGIGESDKAAVMLIDEYRGGKLGRTTLDQVSAPEDLTEDFTEELTEELTESLTQNLAEDFTDDK